MQSHAQLSDQNKARRVAEREGRRSRRRKHRHTDMHHEGQSTDEEETEADAVKFRAEASKICCSLFVYRK